MRRSGLAAKAFTLVELLVVFVVIAAVAAMVIGGIAYAKAEAGKTRNIHQMRQIYVGILNYATMNNGFNYTQEDIGYSSYRSGDDPMGLPQLLQTSGALSGAEVWMNPMGRPELKEYTNNYCWNRSAVNFCGKRVGTLENASTVAILWDNYCYTLPSAYNVPEPITGGPRVPPAAYYRHPFEGGTGSQFMYADGHVGMTLFKQKKK